MQAQKEAPPDMQCKDKFLLQSVVASPGATTKDITPEMVTIQQNKKLFLDRITICSTYPPKQNIRQFSPTLHKLMVFCAHYL